MAVRLTPEQIDEKVAAKLDATTPPGAALMARAGAVMGDAMDAMRGLRADYDAAKPSQFRRRRNGMLPSGSGADWHVRIESDYMRLMEQARDLDRNDMVIGQGVTRYVENIFPGDFKPDPLTGDAGLNKEIKARFNGWSEDPMQVSLSGEDDLTTTAALVTRHGVVDGDMLPLLLDNGKIQLVEGHRLRSPMSMLRGGRNIHLGVAKGEYGEALEYFVTNDDLTALQTVKKMDEVTRHAARLDPRPDLGQIYAQKTALLFRDPKRASQTRGISAFAPIFDVASMLGDINFANLVKHQVASCIAIIEEMAANAPLLTNKPQEVGPNTPAYDPRLDGSVQELKPGMHLRALPGRTLKIGTPGVVAADFLPHAQLMLGILAVNLGVPVATLMLDPHSYSWSSARWVTDEARKGFRRVRRRLVNSFYTPVYNWKLAEFCADDAVMRAQAVKLMRQGKSLYAHRWTPPQDAYIDPLKDVQARLLREKTGQSSPRRLSQEDGLDFHEITQEIVEDNFYRWDLAAEKAVEFNDKYPQFKLHPRELLFVPMPDGVVMRLMGQTESFDDTGANGGKKQVENKPDPKREPSNAA